MITLRWFKTGIGYEQTFFTMFALLKALKILRNRYGYIAVTVILSNDDDCSYTFEAKKNHDKRMIDELENFIEVRQVEIKDE